MKGFLGSKGYSSGWGIVITFLFVSGAIVWGLWPKGKTFEEVTGFALPWSEPVDNEGAGDDQGGGEYVSMTERFEIEKWITDRNLNQYGDPADTLYAGSSPLFDESTGKSITRWEYILKNHPDKPWKR